MQVTKLHITFFYKVEVPLIKSQKKMKLNNSEVFFMLRDSILQISSEFIEEAEKSPRLMEDMASMEKYMAENYDGRIFIELLQNSDDAFSSKIKILECNNHLIFANDGRSFNENDVLAISRSGASSKQKGKSIGHRGIGFKSTTYLSTEIVIYSEETYFSFSKSMCSKILNKEESKIPTVRIPFLVDDIEEEISNVVNDLLLDGFSTVFIFKHAKMDKFVEELKVITNSYFLFLRNIEKCSVDLKQFNTYISVDRKAYNTNRVVSIIGQRNNQWLLLGNEHSQIAFKYENKKIVPCLENEAFYHCYLPTLDKVTFPIKLNSNFSTDPSRKHITLDELSINSIKSCAREIVCLIEKAINGELSNEYEQIFSIFSQNISFSRTNSLLTDTIDAMLSTSKWIRLASGNIVSPERYQLLPDWLDESEKETIRIHSNIVSRGSISTEVYKNFTGVDLFLKQYCNEYYKTNDLVNILEDLTLVEKLSNETLGKLIGNIIKSCKTEELISGKSFKLDDIKISSEDGVVPISKLSNKSIIGKDLKKLINQVASHGDIEWFCKKVKINKELLITEKNHSSLDVLSQIKSFSQKSKYSLSKWRSAEEQCVEMEASFGNKAIDVSKKNVGYDVESKTPAGEKRYIEVKLLQNEGSSFSITNNEYTAAHQYGEEYYLCLIKQSEHQIKALYIQNPLEKITFEKRIRQWEWYCEEYLGEEYIFNL
jgi:hypothetical protein